MRTRNSFLSIVYKITEMTRRQLLSNTNYLTDCNETLDLVFLKLALHKNDKDFILVTPSGREARDFSNDLILSSAIDRILFPYILFL